MVFARGCTLRNRFIQSVLEGNNIAIEQVIIPINYIERKPNSKKYRIVGKGVTVEFLSLFINNPQWSVERICEEYGLTPAEVYAAWSFYSDHQDEIDRTLREERELEEAYQSEHPEIRERRDALIKRYEEMTGQ